MPASEVRTVMRLCVKMGSGPRTGQSTPPAPIPATHVSGWQGRRVLDQRPLLLLLLHNVPLFLPQRLAQQAGGGAAGGVPKAGPLADGAFAVGTERRELQRAHQPQRAFQRGEALCMYAYVWWLS